MKQDLLAHFSKYNKNNSLLLEIEQIYDYYFVRESAFSDYIKEILIKSQAGNNLLVLAGLCNLLILKFPKTSRDYMAMKKVNRFKNAK